MNNSVPIMEKVLLILFISFSITALIGSRNFNFDAALFPRLTAGIALMIATPLLFRGYLPKNVKKIVLYGGREKRDSFDDSVDADEILTEKHKIEGNRFYGIIILTGLFLCFSYLFGMVLIAPVFVVVYGVWSDLPWKSILLITVIVMIFLYVITQLLNVPVDRGVIDIWRGIL